MKIYVVRIGPGSADGKTIEARNVLEKAGVIVGYTVYAELVKKLFPEKEYFVSAMKQEAERCRKAVEMAADGRNVAVVCSGDAGVYGMASLVYEIAAAPEATASAATPPSRAAILCSKTSSVGLVSLP